MASTASPSQRPSAPIVIACLALTLSGIAVGILIGRNLGSTPPVARAEDGSTVQVDLGPVLGELRKIEELLSRAPIPPKSGSDQPSEPRSPAIASDTRSDRLSAAIERLNGLLDRGTVQGGGMTPGAAHWKGPGYQSLEAMWQWISQQIASGNQQARDNLHGDLIRSHMLWTRDDVIERYGAPASVIGDQNGITLMYRLGSDHDTQKAVYLYFRTVSGIVTSVDLST